LKLFEQRQTSEGAWVKLLPSSARQFCSNNELEAWSLAVDRHQMVYLRHEDEVLSGNLLIHGQEGSISVIHYCCFLVSAGSDKSSPAQLLKPAYDFSESAERQANLSAFSSPEPVSTFIFGIDKDSEFPRPTSSQKSPPKGEVDQSPKSNVQSTSESTASLHVQVN
jgi:E3 ubiquitin-protein ligase MYCBP2